MRSSWVCYFCPTSGRDVRKLRFQIDRTTHECVFLCKKHLHLYQKVVIELRSMLGTRKSPPPALD